MSSASARNGDGASDQESASEEEKPPAFGNPESDWECPLEIGEGPDEAAEIVSPLVTFAAPPTPLVTFSDEACSFNLLEKADPNVLEKADSSTESPRSADKPLRPRATTEPVQRARPKASREPVQSIVKPLRPRAVTDVGQSTAKPLRPRAKTANDIKGSKCKDCRGTGHDHLGKPCKTCHVPAPKSSRPFNTSWKEVVEKFKEEAIEANSRQAKARKSMGVSASWAGLPTQIAAGTTVQQSWLDDRCFEEPAIEFDRFESAQFVQWVGYNWGRLHELFNMDGNLRRGGQRRSISRTEFVDYLHRSGYQGDAERVFKLICSGPCIANGDDFSPCSPTSPNGDQHIRLPQLLHFQRQATAMAAPVVEDEVQCFIKQLRHLRGTVLRAWRVDLDRHSVGRITFGDLAHACRKLNSSAEVRSMWNTLRGSEGSTAPIRLAELAPDEAANLDLFAEVLWLKFGFDMDKVWARIDVNGKGIVTLEEFTRGARSMGFAGHAKIIFRGLDVTGLGRLRRPDLDYLQVLLLPGTEAHSAMRDFDPVIRGFVSWVQEELGGVDVFIARLGFLPNAASPGRGSPASDAMSPSGQQHQQGMKLTVKELVKRLQTLGFSGDALHVAVVAARNVNGAQITPEALVSLLNGKRGLVSSDSGSPMRARVGSPGSPSSPGAPLSARSSPSVLGSSRGLRKHPSGWDSGVHNLADCNTERSPCTRNYFSVPERGLPLWGSASYASPACPSSPSTSPPSTARGFDSPAGVGFSQQARLPIQAKWDSSVQDITQQDNEKSRYTRMYFSKPDSLSCSESGKARSQSPYRAANRMTILPDRILDTDASNALLSRSPTLQRSTSSPSTSSPQSARPCERNTLRSKAPRACLTVGPWSRSSKKVLVARRLIENAPRRTHPGDDSSEASLEQCR